MLASSDRNWGCDVEKNIERFCLLLASSDFSEKQLWDLLHWLRTERPQVLLEAVTYLRTLARRELGGFLRNRDSTFESSPARLTQEDFALKVERLLKLEARLSNRVAAEMLIDAIGPTKSRASRIRPPAQKESFRRWLEKLAHDVSPSELLHHATMIRNRVVHEPGGDWPLRKRDEP